METGALEIAVEDGSSYRNEINVVSLVDFFLKSFQTLRYFCSAITKVCAQECYI